MLDLIKVVKSIKIEVDTIYKEEDRIERVITNNNKQLIKK